MILLSSDHFYKKKTQLYLINTKHSKLFLFLIIFIIINKPFDERQRCGPNYLPKMILFSFDWIICNCIGNNYQEGIYYQQFVSYAIIGLSWQDYKV